MDIGVTIMKRLTVGVFGASCLVPLWAMLGGVGAILVIGGLGGLYPAVRASRLAPTDALAAS
jgi:putative ABC transport system permease protein